MKVGMARFVSLGFSLLLGFFSVAQPCWASSSPTTTTLAVTAAGSATASVAAGAVVTLTAAVKSGTASVTLGQVNFCDASAAYCTDIHLLGSAQLTSAGTATMQFRPGIASHSYKAVFVGTPNSTPAYAASTSSTAALTVTGKYPTATVIAQSGTAGNYTLTATVTGSSATPVPTGTVSFLDTNQGNTVLGTAQLSPTSAAMPVFLFPPATTTGSSPAALAVGDFNGDGIPDLAVANLDETSVTILLGNGGGTFTQAPNSPVTTGDNPVSIAVGDFNGDGKQDLAVLSNIDETATILLGNGDGTFTAAPGSPILVSDSGPISIAVADFNGDGKADLVVANNDNYSASILLGNGDGTFTPASNSPVIVGQNEGEPEFVAVGDFNHDGIPDFAVASTVNSEGNPVGGIVSIFLGNGDGTFTQAAQSPVTVGLEPQSLVVGDFNGDGNPDLAAMNTGNGTVAGTMTILLGNGDGTFNQAPGSPVTIGIFPQAAAIGDFNADGKADLAVVNANPAAVWFLLGNGDGTFTQESDFPVGVFAFTGSVAAGDFNGDGTTDLAASTGQAGSISILLSQQSEATATLSGISVSGTEVVAASYPGGSSLAPSQSGTTQLSSTLPAPVISPAAGSAPASGLVTITDATPGATIYYEYQFNNGPLTNGFVPYTAPIPLEVLGTATIQAYATMTGYQQSATVSATYIVDYSTAAATPVLSLAPGYYAGSQTLTMTDSTPGAAINYSVNGSNSSIYSGPITVSSSEIVDASAIAPGYAPSAAATAQYDIGTSSSRFIYTIAGNQTIGYTGDGGPATLAELNGLQGVAVDSTGNVYMADSGDNVVRKVAAGTGIITTIAGTGVAGHTGDNGPAASAELWGPSSLAVDPSGNLFIGEADGTVRRIAALTGTITTFAGNEAGTGGIGSPASDFNFGSVSGIACDPLGNLYVLAGDEVVEVNASSGNIANVTIFNSISGPYGIAVDSHANIYISDQGYSLVWVIHPGGVPVVFAGSTQYGLNGGDGGPATSASLDFPGALAADGAGNVYIADQLHYAIRQVNTAGIINTVAGAFQDYLAPGGDGSPATSVALSYPLAIAADSAGNLYLGDPNTPRIRKVTIPILPPTAAAAAPVFSLAADTYSSPQALTITDATPGAEIYVSLNGSAPTTLDQGYHGPIEITGSVTVKAVAVGPGYLASAPVSATYTITTPPAAVISTVAGDGVFGMLGIGGAAASAEIGEPVAVTFDGAGNLYIADGEKYVVWMVSATTGEITIVAGNGTFGYAGDGGPATAAELGGPDGLAVDKAGNLYIADGSSDRIRMVTAQTGVITTIAGPGVYGTLGDGGPATSAFLRGPGGIGFDSAGNLYIADSGNNRIRMIAAKTGIISTVAGGGVSGLLGDGGLATAATLSNPDDLALDSAADLYITDFYDGRVRRVDAATGLISTAAGNGVLGDNGDGGLATEAEIDSWRGIAVDDAGNLYLSNLPDTLRKVDATTGIITTIAGDGYFGYGGDGGAATMAELYEPKGLAFDAAENLYIADSANYRVRKLTFPQPQPQTIVFTPPSPVYYGIPSITLTATGGASGNPVTFSIVSGPGSLSGTNNSILKVTGTGAIVIAANQAGNAGYAAATQVTSNISVVSPAAAALTSPAPGTVLAGSSVTFAWAGAADPTGYYLWIGSTGVGSNNIYNSEEKAVTTYTFNGLPTNGETIYVRLITNFNGTWVPRDYTYTAARKGVPMTSPTPGSTLGGSSVTFTWSTVSGATGYYLWIGTTGTGSSDLYYSAEKTVNSYTFTRMPTNGEKIYVRLTTNYSGIWAYNDYTYTSSAPAVLTSPAAGATLAGPDVTFDWAAAPNATGYYLWIGSTGVGSNNIYNSAEKTGTSYTFNGLPTNGETLYVRLTTNYNGTWVHNDYTYTAATQAVLTSPTPAGTLSGRSVAFEWTAATGATGYYLWIGSTGTGSNNIYNSALKTVTAYTFPSMPTNGETIYVRLTTNFNGVWVHQDYTYTAAPSQP